MTAKSLLKELEKEISDLEKLLPTLKDKLQFVKIIEEKEKYPEGIFYYNKGKFDLSVLSDDDEEDDEDNEYLLQMKNDIFHQISWMQSNLYFEATTVFTTYNEKDEKLRCVNKMLKRGKSYSSLGELCDDNQISDRFANYFVKKLNEHNLYNQTKLINELNLALDKIMIVVTNNTTVSIVDKENFKIIKTVNFSQLKSTLLELV